MEEGGKGDFQSFNRGESEGVVKALGNWVRERPFTAFNQRRVRQNIANAITTDVLHPVGVLSDPKVDSYRSFVDKGLSVATCKLSELPRQDSGVIAQTEVQTDCVTGDSFLTRVRRDGGVWVSEEIGVDGSVISQARIDDQGGQSLTLNFSSKRYEDRRANPNITDSDQFPTGAKVLFLNHLASIGIIDWKGR